MIIKTIEDLYSTLKRNTEFKYVSMTVDTLVIQPYSEFKIEIYKKDYFDIYINGLFYYSVEPEDVLEFITDFFSNKFVFIESTDKKGKKSVKCIDIAKVPRFFNTKNVKIYSNSKVEN